MEHEQREIVTSPHPLRRETMLPSAAGPSRPCVLVGLSLVALCLAASLDAFLWHQAREREDAEIRLQAVQGQARSLIEQLKDARSELRRERALNAQIKLQKDLEGLQKDMDAAQRALDKAQGVRNDADRRLLNLLQGKGGPSFKCDDGKKQPPPARAPTSSSSAPERTRG